VRYAISPFVRKTGNATRIDFTKLRPKTFRIIFNPQILDKFLSKNNRFKFTYLSSRHGQNFWISRYFKVIYLHMVIITNLNLTKLGLSINFCRNDFVKLTPGAIISSKNHKVHNYKTLSYVQFWIRWCLFFKKA
jgi:hypothetical protein